jgi:hypothetical protein
VEDAQMKLVNMTSQGKLLALYRYGNPISFVQEKRKKQRPNEQGLTA